MSDYPYIHANAKRCGWTPRVLAAVLAQAETDQAPGDSFAYAPKVSDFWETDAPNIWHRASELRQRAQAGCIHSKLVLEELGTCL